MNKLIEQTKDKLTEELQTIVDLTKTTNELDEKANFFRKICFPVIGVSFLINFIGYAIANPIVIIVSLLMLLPVAVCGFHIIDLDDKVEKNRTAIKEHEDNVKTLEDEIERLYTRKEVLDVIQSKQVDTYKHEPLPIQVNVNEKQNNKIR